MLEPKDPSVRHEALIDLLHLPKNAKDVVASRDKIPSSRLVKRIIGSQNQPGFLDPKE